jgi:hypothetical protein
VFYVEYAVSDLNVLLSYNLQSLLVLSTHLTSKLRLTMPWLRRLDAGLSQQRFGFVPRSIHVGFVVDKEELG